MSFSGGARGESPIDIVKRGTKPEDVGMSQEEYQRRVAEAAKPWKVQKSRGALNIQSSARSQQILTKGVLNNLEKERISKKEQLNTTMWRAKVGISIVSLVLGCGMLAEVLIPLVQVHLARRDKRHRLQQRWAAENGAQDVAVGTPTPSNHNTTTSSGSMGS